MVSEHQDKTNLPLPLTSDVLKTTVEVAVREAIAALFPSFVAQVSAALARETTASEGLTFKFEATGNQSMGNSFVPENFMSGFENTTRFDDISESRRIPIPSHGYLGGENSERQQILHQRDILNSRLTGLSPGNSYQGSQSLSTSIEGGAKWLVNKVKGKMQKPLPELLKEYDLAIGIFPRDATNYEFNEETGKLTVYIPSICEVGYRDSSVLRFSTIVCGYLERGKLVDIEGMKTKMIVWVKVTCISSDKSKLNFSAGMKKSRGRDAYEVLRDGVVVDKF